MPLSTTDVGSLDTRPTRLARVGYTLAWPGLGHFLDRRNKAGALFSVWTLGLAIALLPAFDFPRSLVFLEIAAVAVVTTVDVLRDPPPVV